MKKAISILFIGVYLFSATPLGELLKIPMLIEHFAEHQKDNIHLSFFDFLEIHYAHGNPKDADYIKDMRLPFKTASNAIAIHNAICMPQAFFLVDPVIYYINNNNKFSEYTPSYSSSFLDSIWQPPKYC